MQLLGSDWIEQGTTVSSVARALSRLRVESDGRDGPGGRGGDRAALALRTSVMTHIAWVPPAWLEAALRTLDGLAERHPSRTILLVPEPGAAESGLDAEVALRRFDIAGLSRDVATEVVLLRLRGGRAAAPASIVAPLLVSDLPVFLRWRGEPPFGSDELDQLTGIADRMVVDSREWEGVPRALARLVPVTERLAVSDLVWRRTEPWRRALAALWPGIAAIEELHVRGPLPDAHLLAGWLRSRLRREVLLTVDVADRIEAVAVDGAPVEGRSADARSQSDELSRELDVYGRDPVYEQALASVR
jgi:glucose-6-phosphate dehydrogenase assembly protein OpcA